MIKTMTGAATLALVWGSLATAQAVIEQQPAGRQDDPTTGQRTAHGRIISIGDRAQANQTGQPDAQPASRSGQESAQGMYITVAAQQGERRPTAVLGDSDEVRDAARDDITPQREQPNTDQPGRVAADSNQPMLYRFLVTEQTRIVAPDSSAADEIVRDEPGQTLQEGLKEYRGLKVGQHVEVSYRPMAGEGAGLAGRQDVQDSNQPGQVQANQGNQRNPGRAMRGEAISIRVHDASESGDRETPDTAPVREPASING